MFKSISLLLFIFTGNNLMGASKKEVMSCQGSIWAVPINNEIFCTPKRPSLTVWQRLRETQELSLKFGYIQSFINSLEFSGYGEKRNTRYALMIEGEYSHYYFKRLYGQLDFAGYHYNFTRERNHSKFQLSLPYLAYGFFLVPSSRVHLGFFGGQREHLIFTQSDVDRERTYIAGSTLKLIPVKHELYDFNVEFSVYKNFKANHANYKILPTVHHQVKIYVSELLQDKETQNMFGFTYHYRKFHTSFSHQTHADYALFFGKKFQGF